MDHDRVSRRQGAPEDLKRAMFRMLVAMCFAEVLAADNTVIPSVEALQREFVTSAVGFRVLGMCPTVTTVLFWRRWKRMLSLRWRQEELFVPWRRRVGGAPGRVVLDAIAVAAMQGLGSIRMGVLALWDGRDNSFLSQGARGDRGVSRFFSWPVDRREPNSNPCHGPRPSAERPRERNVVHEPEAHAAGDDDVPLDGRRVLRLEHPLGRAHVRALGVHAGEEARHERVRGDMGHLGGVRVHGPTPVRPHA
ncbi:unnamed protein product [Miscanthus lutarioriparius]|uniref:Uncharacterized protein n=1 Tax=Miscanthus lutarioriparius TaxID=422564 RepID=A0A811Q3C7_9POAL|nr:unnamed protein product [Miscanthus lutarioriparius]